MLQAFPLAVFAAACGTTWLLHDDSGSLRSVLSANGTVGGSAASNEVCEVRDQPWEQRCDYVRTHRADCAVDEGLIPYIEVAYCWVQGW